MKMFDKPWLEIINIDIASVIVTSSEVPDEGDPDYDSSDTPIDGE